MPCEVQPIVPVPGAEKLRLVNSRDVDADIAHDRADRRNFDRRFRRQIFCWLKQNQISTG